MKLNLINLLSKVRFKSSLGSKMVFVGCQWVFPTSLWDETILDPSHGVYGLQDLGWQKVSFGFKLLSED